MSNEIDNKIYSFIKENYPHPFQVFQTRFNSSTADAIEVFQKVHEIYGRYMTRDYCVVMLGLAKYRVEKALNTRV